jgi:hypothetical protein
VRVIALGKPFQASVLQHSSLLGPFLSQRKESVVNTAPDVLSKYDKLREASRLTSKYLTWLGNTWQ